MENLDKLLKQFLSTIDKNNKPNLFLHVCCGPCLTYVIKYLYEYFNIYIVFYNPNIDTENEYVKRHSMLNKIFEYEKYNVVEIDTSYKHNEFLEYVKNFENEKEGGKRCEKCIRLRINKTFKISNDYIIKNNIADKKNYITTTLSISPHKNSEMIYNICKDISLQYDNLTYLYSDFKKNDGFLKSIQLSKEYDLYRQEYCGCEFSKIRF